MLNNGNKPALLLLAYAIPDTGPNIVYSFICNYILLYILKYRYTDRFSFLPKKSTNIQYTPEPLDYPIDPIVTSDESVLELTNTKEKTAPGDTCRP